MFRSGEIIEPTNNQKTPQYAAKLIIMFVVYFLAAKIGLKMDAVSGFATLIWPPTGIALAALLLNGNDLWPGIFLGAFAINYATGAPPLVAVGMAAGNTLEAVVGAHLLQRVGGFHKPMDRLKDILWLVVLASTFSTLISPTVGVTSLWLGHIIKLENIGAAWRAWWLGDSLGDLIIAPLILVWATTDFNFKKDIWRAAEGVLLGLLLAAINFVELDAINRHAFWFFPFVVWGALRFGQIGNITVVFIISLMSVWKTAHGASPFAHGSLRSNLFLLDSFMVVISITGMTLAASLAERRQALESLRKAIQTRDDFLSIASHELKTPLTSLTLQIQMAKEKFKPEKNIVPAPEKLAKIFDISEKQIHRLTALVDDLLDASRIQIGKFVFNFKQTNLSEALKDMVDRFSEEFKKAQCPLEIAIEENIWGSFDRPRIEQIIDNLLSNVLKYAPGKPVRVSLSRNDKMVRLIVGDGGPGIPLDKQSKIFERLGRISDSASITGLGLGLFIVNEIAKGHKGSVHVESGAGTGSKFIVEMPLS